MRITRLLYVASAAVAVLPASTDAQSRALRDEVQALRTAVEASAARTSQAFSRGDVNGFIQPYAPEIWVFPPNAEPFQGRAAASDFFARGYAQGTRNLQLTTTGVDRSGSLGYETGTYTSDYPTPGGRAGATTRDYGKYVHVWKRDVDGVWRIHLATWSSNLPPAPMTR